MELLRDKVVSFCRKNVKLRPYSNVVDAARWSRYMRRFSGSAVIELTSTHDNRIERRFTPLGFAFFILWNCIYLYCSIIAHKEDQTILRHLHKTKLQRYGDDFERFSSLTYVIFAMVFTPFLLSSNVWAFQKMVDLDQMIENTGDILDYTKTARTALAVSVSQVAVCIIRMLCIWLFLRNDIVLPPEKLFQVIFTDTQAIIVTSLFVFFLIIVRNRFKWISNTLLQIKERNCWEYKMFVRRDMPVNVLKVTQIEDRQVCEKIRTCAKVYGLLFKICDHINKHFGVIILLTMLNNFNYIVLYLFYFMEATATGLFHDIPVYIDFLVYTFWEITIALGIIFLIVYFSESTMKEALNISFTIHEIIQEDLSPTINNESMQFSTQLLHEKPVFAVLGLFELNYSLLQQGARSVFTYLIILLQFVTDTNK